MLFPRLGFGSDFRHGMACINSCIINMSMEGSYKNSKIDLCVCGGVCVQGCIYFAIPIGIVYLNTDITTNAQMVFYLTARTYMQNAKKRLELMTSCTFKISFPPLVQCLWKQPKPCVSSFKVSDVNLRQVFSSLGDSVALCSSAVTPGRAYASIVEVCGKRLHPRL